MDKRRLPWTEQENSEVAQLRVKAGLTQEELAELAGVPLPTLRKVERGWLGTKNPGIVTLARIRDALQDALGREFPIDDICGVWIYTYGGDETER